MIQEQPKLLNRLRSCIRSKGFSYNAEKIYVHRVGRCILFYGKTHPEKFYQQ